MPWWGTLYLIAFVVAIFGGIRISFRDGERLVFLVFDLIAGLILAYLVAAFWVHQLREFLGWVGPFVFLLAMTWEIIDTPREIRQALADPEMSKTESWVAISVSLCLITPAYLLAGFAAFKDLVA